ncbi:hypothetical protein B5M09_001148 [Aphanomyces astaci]|uniref:Cyclic nucleotide-binding domain-containing protein n=1 Tax=Aphanomyces astaci TaxID=112090 RepID=A0A425CGT8_APHAT|nr:hypothetical protein B5M09_001148 [Aphanomyces astaci]
MSLGPSVSERVLPTLNRAMTKDFGRRLSHDFDTSQILDALAHMNSSHKAKLAESQKSFVLSLHSPWKPYWDVLQAVAAVYAIVLTPLQLAFHVCDIVPALFVIQVVVDTLFVDSVLHFNTTFIDANSMEEVFNRRHVFRHYLVGAFVTDWFTSVLLSYFGHVSPYIECLRFGILCRVLKPSSKDSASDLPNSVADQYFHAYYEAITVTGGESMQPTTSHEVFFSGAMLVVGLLADLPTTLTLRLQWTLHQAFMRKVPFFQTLEPEGLLTLLQCMEEWVALTGDVIIRAGEEELFLVLTTQNEQLKAFLTQARAQRLADANHSKLKASAQEDENVQLTLHSMQRTVTTATLVRNAIKAMKRLAARRRRRMAVMIRRMTLSVPRGIELDGANNIADKSTSLRSTIKHNTLRQNQHGEPHNERPPPPILRNHAPRPDCQPAPGGAREARGQHGRDGVGQRHVPSDDETRGRIQACDAGQH